MTPHDYRTKIEGLWILAFELGNITHLGELAILPSKTR